MIAADVAELGYDSIAVVEHGAAAFQTGERQTEVRFISRDALALLLGHPKAGEKLRNPEPALVLDLRRPDERALFGKVEGTVALPAHQLGSALAASDAEWQHHYRRPKPPPEALLVMMCRTNRRAAWAAQLAADAGYTRVLVSKSGVYFWRLDQSVKPYSSYDPWDPPPEPEDFKVEQVDKDAAF